MYNVKVQCAANTSSSFVFLQVVLVDRIPLSSCTVYRYLCGILLDDISTREQFAFLVYCYRVKAIFHNLCALLASVWPNKAAVVKYLLNWSWCAWSVEGSLKQWLLNGKLLLLSLTTCQVCLAHCRQELQKKSWKTARLFLAVSRPRLHDPRPRLSFLSARRLETKTLVSMDYITGLWRKRFVEKVSFEPGIFYYKYVKKRTKLTKLTFYHQLQTMCY